MKSRTLVTYLVDGRSISVPQQVPFEGSYKGGRGRPIKNSEAASRVKPQATMIFSDQSWVVSVCWCDTEFIGVKQVEVVWGLTRSCGRYKCKNPLDGSQVLGHAVSLGLLVRPELVVDGGTRGVYREHITEEVYFTAPRRWMPKRKRTLKQTNTKAKAKIKRPYAKRNIVSERALRRDLIESYWKQGKRYRDIALKLNTSQATVENDIIWLRAKGRL